MRRVIRSRVRVPECPPDVPVPKRLVNSRRTHTAITNQAPCAPPLHQLGVRRAAFGESSRFVRFGLGRPMRHSSIDWLHPSIDCWQLFQSTPSMECTVTVRARMVMGGRFPLQNAQGRCMAIGWVPIRVANSTP